MARFKSTLDNVRIAAPCSADWVFAANALKPAKVNQVRITDSEKRLMEVIINGDQLELVLGRSGQNVRMAAKLVGWNIDIRPEEEA